MVKLILDKRIDDWKLLPKYSKEPGSIYMDGYLYDSYNHAKGIMKKKNVDLVTVCSGYPGSGKSKLISQIASFCDPTFSEDRMFQNSTPFIEACKSPDTPIGAALVLDEAWEGLSSTQVRKEVGRIVMSILNKVRQKRLYIFIVLPDFFDLSKNIAIFRSRWLIHCYEEEFGDIGRFAAFDREAKRQLYIRGKRYEDYNAHPASCFGVFTSADPPNFNWKRYENVIKKEGLENDSLSSKLDDRPTVQRNKLINYLKVELKQSVEKISQVTGMAIQTIYDALNKFKPSPSEESQYEDPAS